MKEPCPSPTEEKEMENRTDTLRHETLSSNPVLKNKNYRTVLPRTLAVSVALTLELMEPDTPWCPPMRCCVSGEEGGDPPRRCSVYGDSFLHFWQTGRASCRERV